MLAVLATLLIAQSPPTPTPPATAPSAAPPSAAAANGPATSAAHARRRVLVLDPTSESVPAETRRVIASLVTEELQTAPGLEVLSAGELAKMADLEARKQASGCDNASCLSELAGAIGAELIVFGDAATLGSITIVTLQLFDAAKATAVARAQVQVDHPEDMPAKIREAAHTLVPDAAPPPAQSSVVPWVLIGGSVLVGVSAVILDVTLPSSHDHTLGAMDFVGPAGYVAAAGALTVGVVLLATDGG